MNFLNQHLGRIHLPSVKDFRAVAARPELAVPCCLALPPADSPPPKTAQHFGRLVPNNRPACGNAGPAVTRLRATFSCLNTALRVVYGQLGNALAFAGVFV